MRTESSKEVAFDEFQRIRLLKALLKLLSDNDGCFFIGFRCHKIHNSEYSIIQTDHKKVRIPASGWRVIHFKVKTII